MSTSKIKVFIRNTNRILIACILLAIVFTAMAVKTTPVFCTLAFASVDIQLSDSDEVYEGENAVRQKLYNSDDAYIRWFAHDMGRNWGLRVLSALLYLVQLAGAGFFTWLTIKMSIHRVKLAARYDYLCRKERAVR